MQQNEHNELQDSNENAPQSAEYIHASGIHLWVRRTFQFLIIVGLLVLAYQYLNSYSCDEVNTNFRITPDTVRINETVTFEDISSHSKLQFWQFGDDSIATDKRTVNHSYQKAGEYFVTLRVNDKCEATKRIWVLPDYQEVRLACPKIAYVGQKVVFSDETENSTNSAWTFGDNTTGTGKKSSHIYNIEGVKVVTLTINNNKNKTATTTITIVPANTAITSVPVPIVPTPIKEVPPEPLQIGLIPMTPPLKTVATDTKKVEVDKVAVEEFLMQVADNQQKAEDFTRYSCGNLSFGVRGNQQRMSFREFCSRIAGRKLKINELEIQRDEKGCIIYFRVDYKTTIRLRTLQNTKAE